MDDHDTSYRLLFSHAEMVRDLLTGFVPESWIAELDLNSLEKMNGSYVSDDLRSRHNDAIWRVRWGQEWIYIYLLLEFQSTVDRFMPVRILTYTGLLYQDLVRRQELDNSRKLPPVLPIVLYNERGRSIALAPTDHFFIAVHETVSSRDVLSMGPAGSVPVRNHILSHESMSA